MSVPRARTRRTLLDAAALGATLGRMAREILERHRAPGEIVLVGVQTRGVPLARRLAGLLGEFGGAAPAVGALDITLYRDDLTTIAPHPLIKGTDIPVSIDGREVILVDDVLFTGRTVRAALDELVDFGRPARIELAVVIDRGHRELPIRADYAGLCAQTERGDIVEVRLAEEDGDDCVVLLGPQDPAPPARRTPRPKAANRNTPRRAAGGRRR